MDSYTINLYTIILIVVYLSVIAFLGYIGYKQTKSSQDFMVAGRKIHPLVMALSYGATFISTAAIVGFGGAAANFGMGILWLTFLNIFVGVFIAFVFFGKRTRKMGHNLDSHTFPELLGKRFNSRFIQIFSGIVIFIFMPIYASSVLRGGVAFMESFFGMSFEVALLLFVSVVAIYVSMGGLKGVMYTDAFQGSIMFLGMIFLLIFTYARLGGVVNAHNQLTELFNNSSVQEQTMNNIQAGFRGWTSMPEFNSPFWWALVSSIVMGVGIGVLAQPQLVVRFMTVKSNRELNRAVVSGGVFILMMTGVAFIMGALSNVIIFEDTNKISVVAVGVDNIIPHYISNYVPEWFGTIFLLALLAAGMSTLSSLFHTMGTAIGRDVYQKGFKKKENSLLITRIGLLIVIVLSTVLTWLSNELDASMEIIARGTALFMGLTAATFLPVYVGAIYLKKMPKASAIGGIVSGFVSSFIWIFFIHSANASSLQLCRLIFGKPFLVQGTSLEFLSNYDPVIIALPISIVVTAVVWLIYKFNNKKDIDQKHVEKCFKGI
ncbi:sodium:solute symporter family protein [Herbivorax sp. ANBcel31]|uniref:sodium:solute symporter family protein n=1 Tax=Herbivorax sp. ANBcel31 TaxID=3069754 RepID=UPI0027AE1660|nr:sodium:solute symporter family protein [Herbivorax sp. ANBcel31]MDQ2085726.1 sodium:solute symporter family protein [Herbivorax sp. ANBcel31]